ncbi:PREDICTED: L-aminoadipate-semialdehyde dehydrogenase-phosphopantetheinyl transferase [Theobroma cacao]|uniref:holo-[acyl-carrier-protein] synthase n=1 Tax=Theobroma cacao TaxID=3641 RepID=A0AB32VC90_THECC|nr:PREDICTED: L-aminoadipate-semialdehyde dehydrogenase-phosphopantetheinyl transferase [Theobroma cacao]
MMEKGVQRWVVDISTWDPSTDDFSYALSLLPQHHHSSITRFVKKDDRKRALISWLLQYALVHEVLGIPYHEIVIKRTLEGKPFLECGRVCLDFPNFNFNVSHHGDYVAIASEPLCLVGLDIVSHMIPEKETVLEFIQNFSSCFSSLEWDQIVTAGSNDEVLTEFYRYWCLKEAYVKATGSGLAYGLHKVEFYHTSWTDISVKVDGVRNAQWRFWLSELGKGHYVSIARGHPISATESYKRTLNQTKFNEEEYNEGLLLPNVSFVWRTVEELFLVIHKAKSSC